MAQTEKSESETETYVIRRDGKPPIRFKGRELAETNTRGRTPEGHEDSRWDRYTLYMTRAGKYVLVHEYVTQWQGELGRQEAWTGEDPAVLITGAGYDDPDGGERVLPEALVDLAERAGIDIAEQLE